MEGLDVEWREDAENIDEGEVEDVALEDDNLVNQLPELSDSKD